MLVGAAPPTGASIREYGLEAIGRFCSQGAAAAALRNFRPGGSLSGCAYLFPMNVWQPDDQVCQREARDSEAPATRRKKAFWFVSAGLRTCGRDHRYIWSE